MIVPRGLLKHATVMSIVIAGGLAGPAGTVGLVAMGGTGSSEVDRSGRGGEGSGGSDEVRDPAAGRGGDGGSGSAQRAPSRRTASGGSDGGGGRGGPTGPRSSRPGLGASVPESADNLLIVSRSAVLGEPMRGPAWAALLSVADGDLGRVDLSDQNSKTAAKTYGAALVYVRTGETEYRDKVVDQLAQLPRASTPSRRGDSGGGVLSVARQLPGYFASAAMVNYRDPAFVGFVDDIRTRDIGGHGRWDALSATSADTANNWGTWALASRTAADLYLGDQADLAEAAAIFQRFTGEDPGAHEGWRPSGDFDAAWACTTPFVGINPRSCGGKSGAVVEDISRSSGSFPKVDEKGLGYSWEALAGSMMTAKMLSLNGYPDVYEWGGRALLRAGQFSYARANGKKLRGGESQHVPWAINKAYGADLAPLDDAGYGWTYGFTDWLY